MSDEQALTESLGGRRSWHKALASLVLFHLPWNMIGPFEWTISAYGQAFKRAITSLSPSATLLPWNLQGYFMDPGQCALGTEYGLENS